MTKKYSESNSHVCVFSFIEFKGNAANKMRAWERWKKKHDNEEDDEAFHGCMREAQCRDVLMLHT